MKKKKTWHILSGHNFFFVTEADKHFGVTGSWAFYDAWNASKYELHIWKLLMTFLAFH